MVLGITALIFSRGRTSASTVGPAECVVAGGFHNEALGRVIAGLKANLV
jgi:hypothetical protein